MRLKNTAILLAAAGLGLGGCATNGLYGSGVSVGYGSGYGGYGSYGSRYGYDGYDGYGYDSPYGYAGYSPYGGRYGYNPYNSYYGWNGGYYYPGTGYYVYDRDRKPRVWTTAERLFWLGRRGQSSGAQPSGTTGTQRTGTTVAVPTTPNWGAFDRRQVRMQDRANRIEQRQSVRSERGPVAARSVGTRMERAPISTRSTMSDRRIERQERRATRRSGN